MNTSIDVAIIGAGPYGLSVAAHLRACRVEFRIFGKPMEYWKANMPPGMLLKSYPWASSLHDPEARFTVKNFCAEQDMPYHDTLMALALESFVAYGETFQRRFVPNVESKKLIALEQTQQGFLATFEDHDVVCARNVVLATGLHAFTRVPRAVAHLSEDVVSHSANYGSLGGLRGKQVIVLGSGASATDLAGLLHEQGTDVSLVARADKVGFACLPRLRSALERLVDPDCGIGAGWVMKACSDAPWLIRFLPKNLRRRLAQLPGPLGGAFMKERVIGEVPLLVGRSVDAAECRGSKVRVSVFKHDGAKEVLQADHVIAATGYKIDINRLDFLDASLRASIYCADGAPILSADYESSVPGLHFAGPMVAASFGPVARFVFGAIYPSRRLARHLSRRARCRTASTPVAARVTSPVLR
jgi:lysine/ornithine N-monooxygenase